MHGRNTHNLRKSNFKETDEEPIELTKAKTKISRDHASRMLEKKSRDYSQWFPGDENDLADSLSRDFHIPPNLLTFLFHQKIPEQTPLNLKISPLPQEISSYVLSMLQKLPEKTQQLERHKTSKIGLGIGGIDSSIISRWETTLSSTNFQKDRELSSSRPLGRQSEKEFSPREQLDAHWRVRQSKPPWTTFLRPSEIMTDQTQGTTEKATLAGFYLNSSRATKKRIREQNTKKLSP